MVDKLYEELDKVKNKNDDIKRLFGAISDTLQAFDKEHKRIKGMSGHETEYFSSGVHKCLAEIIAHLSENYWAKNKYFQKVLPKLFNEAMPIYEKFFKLSKPAKR